MQPIQIEEGAVGVQPALAGAVVATPAPRAGRAARFRLPRLLRNPKAAVGAVILLVFVLAAVLAPVISPGDPTDYLARPHEPPSWDHPLGTTGQGQDVLAQTIWGARVSLGIGAVVGVAATLIGAALGLTAGYFGRRVDDVLSVVMNVFLIVPSLLLLITLAAFLPPGPRTIAFVLTLTGWAWPARILRSQMLSLREKDFVSAAQVSGEGSLRTIFAEILPNMTSLVVAGAFGSTIFAIGAEAGLEFLGLGNVGVVSWGTNLYWAGNNGALITGAWWTIVPAGACIALVAFGLALVNYALDEVTNPRLRAQRETTDALRKLGLRSLGRGRATPVLRGPGRRPA